MKVVTCKDVLNLNKVTFFVLQSMFMHVLTYYACFKIFPTVPCWIAVFISSMLSF